MLYQKTTYKSNRILGIYIYIKQYMDPIMNIDINFNGFSCR